MILEAQIRNSFACGISSLESLFIKSGEPYEIFWPACVLTIKPVLEDIQQRINFHIATHGEVPMPKKELEFTNDYGETMSWESLRELADQIQGKCKMFLSITTN